MKDELLPPKELVKRLPLRNGKRVSLPTVWRWIKKGVQGEKLPAYQMGRTLMCRESDVYAFFKKLAELPPRQKQKAKNGTRHE